MSKVQIDKLIHMGCRTLNEGHKYNWQLIDMKKFKAPQNKIFFVFGGNTTNYPEAANGNAKIVECLLSEENRKKSTIYSFIYDGEPISAVSRMMLDEYREETHDVYESIIKPLLLDHVGNIKEKKGIERVLNNIVFVSHCGGSNFVDIIIDDIYDTLTEKYHESIAKQIIGKLQYFAYAPCELPNKEVNSFIITPFMDNESSWKRVLNEAVDKKIYADSPRGSMKRIFKSCEQGNVYETFSEIFKDQRMVAFRSEQNTYLIPSRLNSNASVGDHSIECLVKRNVLNTGTDYAVTAQTLNSASKLMINQFLNNDFVDHRESFDKITRLIKQSKPDIECTESEFEC